jgi:hypothetical protein
LFSIALILLYVAAALSPIVGGAAIALFTSSYAPIRPTVR